MQKIKTFIVGIIVNLFFLGIFTSAAIADVTDLAARKNDLRLSLFNKAKIVDLTQVLNSAVPSYDGQLENFKYQVLSSIDRDGYASGAFYIHEHLGTHIDAPIHFSTTGISIDKINTNDLFLPAIVIDVRNEVKENPDYLLTVDKVKSFAENNTIPVRAAILLLTGWDKRYFVKDQYRNADQEGIMHFPGFSLKAANYLLENYKIAALGIDTLSIDNGASKDFPVHQFILSKGLFMVENLANLDKIPASGAMVIFAPLKIEGGTGSPARVFAFYQ